jgi:transcriptional regulator with PAS, ATPase and Fis domain
MAEIPHKTRDSHIPTAVTLQLTGNFHGHRPVCRCIVEAFGGAMTDWTKEFPGAVTVCDRDGVISEMNDRSVSTFEADGGHALVGTNLLACHPEPSRGKVADLLANPRVNAYTIEKRGVRKLIYQAPWYRDGVVQGLVELSLEIPESMPHFVREG